MHGVHKEPNMKTESGPLGLAIDDLGKGSFSGMQGAEARWRESKRGDEGENLVKTWKLAAHSKNSEATGRKEMRW